MNKRVLQGLQIMIVEDEHMVAHAVGRFLGALGATIVGPAATVQQALDLVHSSAHLDAALVDLNLGGTKAYPVAEVLEERNIPFVFATGYDTPAIPERYRNTTVFQKPFDPMELSQALLALT